MSAFFRASRSSFSLARRTAAHHAHSSGCQSHAACSRLTDGLLTAHPQTGSAGRTGCLLSAPRQTTLRRTSQGTRFPEQTALSLWCLVCGFGATQRRACLSREGQACGPWTSLAVRRARSRSSPSPPLIPGSMEPELEF
eukprot:816108-Rhodomonas_salina.6